MFMLILASSSPRRQELLRLITDDFIVIPSKYDESLHPNLDNADLAYDLARLKAYQVYKSHVDDIVLACDTIVVLKDEVLGKPKDEEDAKRMLRLLSGKKHVVLSGYTIISKKYEISKTIKTNVYFNKLSESQIEEYIKKHQPLDKAGAYGIQDDFPLISHIEGSYYNVMGLPIEDIKRSLRLLNF